MRLPAADHRPWPLPTRPWVQAQTWHDLAFLHWRVDPERVRAHLPAELELETFGGAAWIGVVPFRMSGVRLRFLPPLPGLSAFPELNVRTYVRHAGRSGVWFFSLDATSALAVAAARAWYHLPYYRARMRCSAVEGEVRYASERTHHGAPPAALVARYRANGTEARARPGSLEHFLAERYCLFSRGPRGLLRGDIHHPPWPLCPGEVEIERNTMTEPLGIPLDGPPLVHVAHRLQIYAWSPTRS